MSLNRIMPRNACIALASLLAGCHDASPASGGSPAADLGASDLGISDLLGPASQDMTIPDGGDPSMVYVPAGTFRMGCYAATDKQCQADESPDHDVTLHAYFIDRTEVTQAAYQACIDAGACTPPSMDFDPAGHAAFPVNFVTREQSVAYCKWQNKRLPTEAEWERAARGTDRRLYPWGNEPPDCTRLNYSEAWPQTSCAHATQAVATHVPGRSPTGADDMGGNVWEWVSDYYDAGYYAVSPSVDPQGPAAGMYRAKRGGSYGDPADRVRASRRWFHFTFQAESDIGFRCAR